MVMVQISDMPPHRANPQLKVNRDSERRAFRPFRPFRPSQLLTPPPLRFRRHRQTPTAVGSVQGSVLGIWYLIDAFPFLRLRWPRASPALVAVCAGLWPASSVAGVRPGGSAPSQTARSPTSTIPWSAPATTAPAPPSPGHLAPPPQVPGDQSEPSQPRFQQFLRRPLAMLPFPAPAMADVPAGA
jgi:hypothetical protein